MATTSLSLGSHWETFIKDQVHSGRYATASEVIRDALRTLEERGERHEALRAALEPGLADADAGRFDEGFSMADVIAGAGERRKRTG